MRLQMRYARTVPAVFLLFALAALNPGVALAETGPWSKPTQLSTTASGWFPAIAADIYGNVHVVWNDGAVLAGPVSRDPKSLPTFEEDASWLGYTRWDGQRWSTPNDIAVAGASGLIIRSALATDAIGRLHLFSTRLDQSTPTSGSGRALRYSVADPFQAGRATAWSAPVRISHRSLSYFTDIAVDSQGTIHLVWTEYDDKSGYGVYYTRSQDGGKTWSPPYAIEATHAAYWFRLQLKVDQRDELHMVWEVLHPEEATSWAATTMGFVYARSKDGGATWDSTAFLSEEAMAASPKDRPASAVLRQQPAIGIDGKGRVVVVWRQYGTDLIYYQSSADGDKWSPPALVPGIGRGVARPFDRYDMATDAAGHVHLVAVGYPSGSGQMALLHSEWDGNRWSAPSIVTGAPPYPEWPRIAVANGNRLHVVWFVGDVEYVSRTPVGIWYATAQTSAPFAQPANTPAPTSTPALATTPTATEVVSPSSEGVQSSGGSDQPAMGAASPDGLRADSTEPLALSLAATGVLLLGAYGLRRLSVLR